MSRTLPPLHSATTWLVQERAALSAAWYQYPGGNQMFCCVTLSNGNTGLGRSRHGYSNRAASFQDALAAAGMAMPAPIDGRGAGDTIIDKAAESVARRLGHDREVLAVHVLAAHNDGTVNSRGRHVA